MSLELYIHIPFCIRKCNYCDFLSFSADEESREAYCKALMEEIRQTARVLWQDSQMSLDNSKRHQMQLQGPGEIFKSTGDMEAAEIRDMESVESIYLGGGTPSVLSPGQLERIMDCLKKEFVLRPDAEVSMEANPGTLTKEKLQTAKMSGINRLSIGLQSTEDALLKQLGRIHSFREFEENYSLARNTGFDNINIDLMSALPGQTSADWRETLTIVKDLKPEHISAYSLIIEEGTPLAENEALLHILPDETEDRKMYEMTKEILGEAGYRRYEISNYALPGKECRHNIGYWDGVPYLGLGLHASSYYNHARFSNESNLSLYLRRPFRPFSEREDYSPQTREEEMEDYMIFGLRMMEGVSRRRFAARFGVEMDKVYGDIIDKYAALALLKEDGDTVRLTDRGIDVSNRIFEELIL